MTKRTQEETLALASKAYSEIFQSDIDLRDINCIDEYDLESSDHAEPLESDNYIIYRTIDSYWVEAQWEDYWFISKIIVKETGEEIFVKFLWFYDDGGGFWIREIHNGIEWRYIFIVKPKIVKVTKYVEAYND